MVTQQALDSRELASVAGAFTRRNFRALGSPSRGALADLLTRISAVAPSAPGSTLGEAFDAAMGVLEKRYRGEYVYKNSIVNRLIFGRHNVRTASALLELRAGKSIADVVICNGTSTAYEIKTDLDGLTRLGSQLSDYSRCFEHVFVVASSRIAPRITDTVPGHVGVLALTNRGSLSEIRPATGDLRRLDRAAMFGLLRRDEVLRVLHRTSGYEVDAPRSRIWRRTLEVFACLPIDVAQAEVVVELRTRGMAAAATASAVPRSLRAMAYEVPQTTSAAQRMHDRLLTPTAALVE